MVVQCPSCQTKFRIADDKVTDKGVRVRCTSCKNVFQVKRSGAESAASQAQTGMTQELQAVSFGPPPTAAKRPPTIPPAAKAPPASAPPRPPASAPPPARPATAPPPARPALASVRPPPAAPSTPPPPAAITPPPPSRGPISLSTASAPGAIGRRRPSAFSLELPGEGEQEPTPAAPPAERPRPSADDLFGMDELTGESSAMPGSPLSSNPTLARVRAPSLPPPPPSEAVPPPPPPDEPRAQQRAEEPPPEPPAPPPESGPQHSHEHQPLGSLDGSHGEPGPGDESPAAPPPPAAEPPADGVVKLGAIKPARRDPFELDLPETASPADATGPAAPAPTLPPPEQFGPRPVQREMVAVALTGLIGIALALALVAVARFTNTEPSWLRRPGEPLIATQIASGLYDVSGERPIFFIRGRVENRGEQSVGPVKVVADLMGANGSMARVETVAGSEPTPEEVHALRSTEEADALVKRLAREGADKKLAPGESAPFFALIAEPPADAERNELRLRLEAGAARP